MATQDHGDGAGQGAEPASRVSSSSKRAATARRRAIVGGVVAVLVAGGAAFLLTGGEDGPLGPVLPGDDGPETPAFAFTVRRVIPETTTTTKAADLKKEADDVAGRVKATLDELYFDGFVESDTWGDFGEIEGLFDGEARAQAETDLDTLTLGASGSETFSFVQPDEGTVAIDVLTDHADRPVQALAFVKFSAVAERDDGSFTQVRSTGSFFLRHTGGGWKIYSYRVERTDRPTDAPAATASASAGASESAG
ncbi:MAG TPA: hypothetical protein VLA82_10505 [Actinomycetota bacterium]|nr:hypothetical protein [Actinomycetota bacterium]